MKKISVKVSTSVRRSGSGYVAQTKVSKGGSTKTTTKYIRGK